MVRGGRQVQRAAGGRPRHAALYRGTPADREGPRRLYLLSRHAVCSLQFGSADAESHAHHHRGCGHSGGRRRGCLVSFGGTDGGYSLYVQDGKLHYVQNYVAKEYLHVSSTETVPSGRHDLRFEFEATGEPDFASGKGSPGRAQLYIDDKLVGQADFAVTTPLSLGLTGGIKVGADPGAPVTPYYAAAVRVHWHVVQRDLRRERRRDQGRRGGTAPHHGAAIGLQLRRRYGAK